MGNFERFPGIADVKLAVFGDGALVNTKDSEPSDKIVDGELEDMCQGMSRGVRLDFQGFGVVAFTGEERRAGYLPSGLA